MSIKLTTSDEKLRQCDLSIDDEMTIYDALAYKEELTNYLSAYQSFNIDLSQIEEIDTAGVQLLLVFRNKINTLGYQLVLKDPSQICLSIFARYGLTLSDFSCGEIA